MVTHLIKCHRIFFIDFFKISRQHVDPIIYIYIFFYVNFSLVVSVLGLPEGGDAPGLAQPLQGIGGGTQPGDRGLGAQWQARRV